MRKLLYIVMFIWSSSYGLLWIDQIALAKEPLIDKWGSYYQIYDLGSGRKEAIVSNALLNYHDGTNWRPLSAISDTIAFPEGKIVSSEAQEVKLFDLPHGTTVTVNPKSNIAQLFDSQGNVIKTYRDPRISSASTVMNTSTKNIDVASFTEHDNAFWFALPRDISFSGLVKIYDDTTTTPIGIDTFIDSNLPDNNYDGSPLDLQNTSNNVAEHILLRFTLPTIEDVTISDARLDLYCSNVYVAGDDTNVEVHSITQPSWVENQATWNIYATGNSWASAGGDYSATVIDAKVANTVAATSWNYWYLMGASADNPLTLEMGDTVNLLLKGSVEQNSTNHYQYRFGSQESGTAPILTLTYSETETSTPAATVTTTPSETLEYFWNNYDNFLITFGAFLLALVIIRQLIVLTSTVWKWYHRL